MDLLDLVKGQLGQAAMQQIAKQIGGSPQQVNTATDGVLSTLMSALAKNTKSQEGASSLLNALDNDHDGGVLDNLQDLIGGNTAGINPRAANGAGILKHLLGNNQSSAVDMISKMSGLGGSQAGSLMTMLAPVLMGALGKQKKQQNLDIGGLANLLNGQTHQRRSSGNPLFDMANKFLDADGDGSAVDDIMSKVGGGLLKSLFR